MKISNPWKIFLWILGTAILMTMSSLIVYYATRQPACPPSTSQKLKLENQKPIEYFTDVVKGSEITNDEANQIKPELQQTIINQMTNLGLTENIDYEIRGLDALQGGAHLRITYGQIEIDALPTSEKASGSARKNFKFREDMTNWSIPDVSIIEDQKPELTEEYLLDGWTTFIKQHVDELLGAGQNNTPGIDYKINGFEFFQLGAKFEDYKDKIWVVAIDTSTNLKGTFKINFI